MLHTDISDCLSAWLFFFPPWSAQTGCFFSFWQIFRHNLNVQIMRWLSDNHSLSTRFVCAISEDLNVQIVHLFFVDLNVQIVCGLSMDASVQIVPLLSVDLNVQINDKLFSMDLKVHICIYWLSMDLNDQIYDKRSWDFMVQIWFSEKDLHILRTGSCGLVKNITFLRTGLSRPVNGKASVSNEREVQVSVVSARIAIQNPVLIDWVVCYGRSEQYKGKSY